MTEATTPAVESAPPADSLRSTPGEFLRKLREEKGRTHAEVGSALHLTVHYIKALESDDYGKLPGLTFVKGYLRSYARFLGADVDNVLARFDEHITNLLDAGHHTARVERSRRRQDQALRWAIGAGFVVVAGLAAGWWFMSGGDATVDTAQPGAPMQQTVTTTAPATALQLRTTTASTANPVPPAQALALPASTQSASGVVQQAMALNNSAPDAPEVATAMESITPTLVATSAPADSAVATGTITVSPAANGARQVSLISTGNDELKVSFSGSSWIEVDDGSQTRLYNDTLSAGDTLTIRGAAPFHILLGDAANVSVSLNAAVVDISADIRADSTARLVLGTPATAPAANPEAPL